MKTIKPATAGNYLSVTQEDGTKFICTEISTYDDASIEYEEITISDKNTIEEQKKTVLPNVVKDTLLQTVEFINADKELQTKLTNIDSSIITTQTKLNYITEIVDNSVGWISQDVKTLFTGIDTSLYIVLNEIFKNKELLTTLQQAYTDGKLTEDIIGLTEVQDEILSYFEDSYTNSQNLDSTRSYLKSVLSDPCAGERLSLLIQSKEPFFIVDPSQSVYNCMSDPSGRDIIHNRMMDTIGTSIIEGIANKVSGGLNSSYNEILSAINTDPSAYSAFTNPSSLHPLANLGIAMGFNSSLYNYIVNLNGTSSSSSGGLNSSYNAILSTIAADPSTYSAFTNPSSLDPLAHLGIAMRFNSSLYNYIVNLNGTSTSSSGGLNSSYNEILSKMVQSLGYETFTDPSLYKPLYIFTQALRENTSASDKLSTIFRGEYYNSSINDILTAMRVSGTYTTYGYTTTLSDPCIYNHIARFVSDCSQNSSFTTLNTWLKNNVIQDLYNKIDELNTKLNNLTSQ